MLETERHDIRTSILDYLAAHPNAEDTLEGIAEWWLLERCIRRQLPVVRTALEELVADGVLISRQTSASEPRYRVNQDAHPSSPPAASDSDDSVPR